MGRKDIGRECKRKKVLEKEKNKKRWWGKKRGEMEEAKIGRLQSKAKRRTILSRIYIFVYLKEGKKGNKTKVDQLCN